MSETKVARLDRVLTELITASSGVQAAAVVSFDGLMIASALPEDLDEDRVGAMSAALLSLGEQAIDGFGCGHLDQLFAHGDQGFVVMMSARDEAVLTAVAEKNAKVGFILYEMRRAADAIADVMVEQVTAEPAASTGLMGHSALPPRPLFSDDRRPLSTGVDTHPAIPQMTTQPLPSRIPSTSTTAASTGHSTGANGHANGHTNGHRGPESNPPPTSGWQ